MSIELTETILTLADAAKLLPRGRAGRPVHLSCILRWIIDGAKSPDGSRVRLGGVRLGSRWVTSREALQRFAEALTPRLDDTAPVKPRTPNQRERASAQAAKQLEAIGI